MPLACLKFQMVLGIINQVSFLQLTKPYIGHILLIHSILSPLLTSLFYPSSTLCSNPASTLLLYMSRSVWSQHLLHISPSLPRKHFPSSFHSLFTSNILVREVRTSLTIHFNLSASSLHNFKIFLILPSKIIFFLYLLAHFLL